MTYFAALADNIGLGFTVALSLNNLFYCLVGVSLGTLLGVLPGIGTLVSMSLLFPITFHLQPTEAIIMLAGIYYGTTYGGSTASILLNLPGTPANAVVCLDGYPMTKQGRAGVALFMTTIASFVGGSIGIVLMMLFSSVIATYALRLGSAEYFMLMLLGLVAASTVSVRSPVKGLAMMVLGISLGMVGADVDTGILRFSFGILQLWDGIPLVAVAMGLFGVSEIIASANAAGTAKFDSKSVTFRSMVPTRDDVRRSWMPMLRGSGIGSFFGTLPGTGGTIAAFMAYAIETKVAKEPERFGKGAIEGIMSPETANNAADQTAFIPTLLLGVPGSGSMAIVLGALMIHGISAGPNLVAESPELFWGLVMSFWIGNLLLLVLNIPMIGLWVRLLSIPYHLLCPAILVLVMIGAYTINNSVFDIWMVLLFGLVGYGLRLLDFPLAPLILGFVLGPLMEENFRRALVVTRGDFMVFVERPISGTILAIILLLLVSTLLGVVRAPRFLKRTGRSKA